MPTKTKLEITSFNRGLITEASPLTFPESASLVDENFVLFKDGSRKRRLGLDKIPSTVTGGFPPGTSLSTEFSIHLWKKPVQNGDQTIIVVQGANIIRFYNQTFTQLLGAGNSFEISLPIDYPENTKIRTASLRGQLIVTYGTSNVLAFDYDEASDTFSYKTYRLQVRDLFGIQTVYNVDERPVFNEPVSNSDPENVKHLYNLRNQGWPLSSVTVKNPKGEEVSGSAVENKDPTILQSGVGLTLRASESDVMWRGRVSSADSAEAVGAYSPWEILKHNYGNTPAPKGKFIIDAFNRSDSRQIAFNEANGTTGLTLPSDKSEGYINAVASYAGRFFYSIKETRLIGGDNKSPRLSTMIFFSQVVDQDRKITACYSEADPTSEFIYDPVDTDGGFIVIPSVGEVIDMRPLGNSLFVFTSNGVWEIHGGEQAFSATNQNLTKNSNIGAISYNSIVTVETSILYWADAGIYSITPDPGTLRGIPSNLSINTIQRHYQQIPRSAKETCSAVFDELDRKVRWCYNNPSVIGYLYGYDTELIFDLELAAFYLNKFKTPPETGPFSDIERPIGVISTPRLMYLTGYQAGGTITYLVSDYLNKDFKDFGVLDASAILLTGYLTGQTPSTSKQIKNLVVHCNRTETGFKTLKGGGIDFVNPGGLSVTMQWEWTNSPSAGRWNPPFEGYRLTIPYYPSDVSDPFDYGYTVITSKTGIRGKGGALSIKFESQPGKDLHLLGWGLEVKVEDDF